MSSIVELIDPEPVKASLTTSDYNGQAIRCYNGSDGVIEAGGTGGTNVYSYLWNTNATSKVISLLPHGTYSVVVSDQNGCSDSEEITLENPVPVVVSLDSISNYH